MPQTLKHIVWEIYKAYRRLKHLCIPARRILFILPKYERLFEEIKKSKVAQ